MTITPPYSFRDADGNPQGLLKEKWDLWQKKTGITVDFLPMDWAAAKAIMADEKADVIDTIFATEVRRKIYDFSDPYATINVSIYFHRSIGGITELKRYASYEALVRGHRAHHHCHGA